MAGYVQKDFEWVRGTTPRIAFEFKTKKTMSDGTIIREPIIFDDCIFTVYRGRKGGELLFRYSIKTGEIILTDDSIGRVEWKLDADDTRSLQETQIGQDGKNRYEIELRAGVSPRLERVYVLGFIAGIGGINSDDGVVEVIVEGAN